MPLFRILTPEESAESERLLAFECPCPHPHHRGLFDGRTTCARRTDRPGLCPLCRRDCTSAREERTE